MAGGGAKGSYEAGVLYTMNNSTKNINMSYNIITGVSIGAINAGILTNFPIGQEKAMVESLVSWWLSINGTSDIFVEWKGGLVAGLLFHGGIYNNDPAIELAHLWIKGARQRNITVGSVNLDLGLFGTFNESVGAAIVDAVQASSSVPFFFSPKNFEGFAWADGGGVINLDIESGILRCLEITGNQRDVVVDVIYDYLLYVLPNETSFKTPQVFDRMFQIRSFDSGIWYNYNAQLAYPNVNYRYTVVPSEPMGPILNFSRIDILNSLNLGYKDGMAIFQETRTSREIVEEHFKRSRTIIYP
jgi:hypothetical protein